MPLATVPESLYWEYVNERYSIYLKKTAGLPKPWTEDPILRTYKFTNIWRAHDTGSVWLRENFLDPHKDDDPALIAANICIYRMFNFWKTGKLLGWQTDWDPQSVVDTLTFAKMRGEKVFTGAHIVRSEFGRDKIDSIVDVCTALWDLRHKIVECCEQKRSLEAVFNLMLTVNYVGPFMSHEFCQDFVTTKLLAGAPDENTWSNAGPGAMRGLERLGLPFSPPAKAVESMLYLLERSKTEWKYTPPLTLHAIEFSNCEIDKYARAKLGEGRPRSTYPGV